MRKIIFDTDDIIDEFLTRADMKGLRKEEINSMVETIYSEKFRLIRTVKSFGNIRTCKVYMCEWEEDGIRDSDEWTRPWDRFAAAVAENYIQQVKRLPI